MTLRRAMFATTVLLLGSDGPLPRSRSRPRPRFALSSIQPNSYAARPQRGIRAAGYLRNFDQYS
jgi:hypothetical protein